MKISGIYKIQSKIKPERCYIGSALNITQRWYQHLCYLKKKKHHSRKLQRHYDKYGKDDLQFSVLIGCDKENLIPNEQFFIDSYKPYFNSRPIAESNRGFKITEESRERYRKGSMGNKYSVGVKHTPEFCKKSSENRKIDWQNPEYRKKVSEGLKRSHAERGKNNNSVQGLRKALSMSHTPEANAKRNENLKKTWALKKQKKLDELNSLNLITNN